MTQMAEVCLIVATMYHHIDVNRVLGFDTNTNRNRAFSVRKHVLHDWIPAVILYLGCHQVAPLLRPVANLLCQWPRWLPTSTTARKWDGSHGPFGYGYYKVVESFGAYVLLRWQEKNTDAFSLGGTGWPSGKSVGAVVLFAMAVNAVLSVWSHATNSRGNHGGVDRMVRSSIGRTLSVKERATLLCMALGNATCEEIVSRGFFLEQFLSINQNYQNYHHHHHHKANLCQSIAFGLWHYYGIPSGWTGVGLTFVYGFCMGQMRLFSGGLFLPIAAHTVADYYIFSVIARRKSD